MTLLQQIQIEAVDSSSELADVLRKCRILAQRLGHKGFKDWVIRELEGYPDQSELPDYRICGRGNVLGHFVGANGRELKNAQIPKTSIPERHRAALTQVRFAQGVAAIKNNLEACQNGALRFAWPAEAYQIVGQGDVFERLNLIQAYNVITTGDLAGILDSIRNKVLNFVLELESRDPDAGEAVKGRNQLPNEQVQQVYNTVINGDVANVAQGGSRFSQQSVMKITKGDTDSLIRAIAELGVSAEDEDELRSAVSAEPKVTKKGFGKKVASWIGRTTAAAAEGALNATTEIATNVITEALKKYYGI